MYVQKLANKQQPPTEQNTFGATSPLKRKEPAMRLETMEDEIENDKELKELSLYKKLVIANSPKGKGKQLALEESKLTSLPPVFGQMVSQMKPAYERRQIAAIIDELRKHKSLVSLLHGIKAEQLSNEEIVLLLIWTSPLVTSVTNNDEYSVYARGILGVDVMEAQGLLRNCKTAENHLINIVESYWDMMRAMPEPQFIQVLRNAAYSLDKAYELQKTLQSLGENWFNMKEQIKTLKLSEAPKVENPKLVKGIKGPSVNMIGGKIAANLPEYQEVDILIKLIPYFELPMARSSKVTPQVAELRKMINLAKSEADMIMRKKRLVTLLDIIKAYFERLIMPENVTAVEDDFLDCFFMSKQRSKLFVQTIARIVWEYNFVNKMFIENYKKLSNLTSTNPIENIPHTREVMIFGGYYPLSAGQVTAIVNIVMSFNQIKGLALNFTRIKNQGMQLIAQILNSKKWKTIRLNDERLFSLDLTNNFIDQDGIKCLIDLFYDQFDIKSALVNEAPLPTSIRILTLDHNFLGKGGADTLGTILATSRQIKVLSLNKTRMIGNDLKKFCQSLSTNPYLKVLNLGMNRLGDNGVQYLANALKVNIGLAMVDLFDVEFSDEGSLALAEALLLNKTLINLRLANTRVKPAGASPLINAIMGNPNLKIFRWVNLVPLPASVQDLAPKDLSRVFIIESRNNPMSRAEYLNPYLGDVSYELHLDVYKCAYYTKVPKEPQLTRELDSVLQSYCDFMTENWLALEKGGYNEVMKGPEIQFKTRINEQTVRENVPELSLEERVLVQMATMDIPKDQSAQYLAEGGKASEFAMLEAEKKKTEKTVTGTKSPVKLQPKAPTDAMVAVNTQQLQEKYTQLDSIPSFAMTEYAQNSIYTRSLGKELLITLLYHKLDMNYHNKQGLSPLMVAVQQKLRSLQSFMLSGLISDLDVNLRCTNLQKQLSTAMHFAVELNDYDALKLLLDYNGEPRREVGLKDNKGKNPLDLAYDLDFQSMKDLLERQGGHQSSQALQEQYKILQIMKPISTKKNEAETITIFNVIIANSVERFQKQLLQGANINDRDEQNQTPLHYTAIHSREPMLMMLVKQGALIDAKDSNGMTPLHHAAMKKDPQTLQQNAKIIERLVTFGANIDSQMKDGSTPLHLACQSDSFANAKVLCTLGAQLGIFNYAKQTPEQVTNSKEIIELMQRTRQERRMRNGGGDEYVQEIR